MPEPRGNLVTPVGVGSDGKIIVPIGAGVLLHVEKAITKLTGITAVAGWNNIDGDAVPAGKIWVISLWIANNDTSINFHTDFATVSPTRTLIAFNRVLNPPALSQTTWTGNVILNATEWPRGRFFGCTAGDSLWFGYHGYEMSAP